MKAKQILQIKEKNDSRTFTIYLRWHLKKILYSYNKQINHEGHEFFLQSNSQFALDLNV